MGGHRPVDLAGGVLTSGIHLNLAAHSPQQMRALFELCMAETNELHYDGKLVQGPGGTGQVYVFGERCLHCKGFGWHEPGMTTCGVCKGAKQLGPAWMID